MNPQAHAGFQNQRQNLEPRRMPSWAAHLKHTPCKCSFVLVCFPSARNRRKPGFFIKKLQLRGGKASVCMSPV